jgi:hypothetical protein
MEDSLEKPKKVKNKQKKRHNKPAQVLPKNEPKSVPIPKGKKAPVHTDNRSGGAQAKERARADALFASTSSQWYAGAAFDRSPDANTLPRPTRLLPSGADLMASSCPTTTGLKERGGLGEKSAGTKTRLSTPPMDEDDDLRKAKVPMGRSRSGASRSDGKAGTDLEPRPQRVVASSHVQDTEKDEDLEEMTRQVRKLLNLS